MPWLLTEAEVASPGEALLLVHIPRTGGTQLYEEYGVMTKARQGRWPISWFFLLWLAHRHGLHESTNFPVLTYENALFVGVMLPLGLFALLSVHWPVNPGIWLVSWAAWGFILFTFIATPTGFRWALLRRSILLVMGIFNISSTERLYGGDGDVWCSGRAWTLLLHMPAAEMVRHELVSIEQMRRVCSFAFVRNPYRRMVSLYLYNRCGPLESFEAFVRRWHACHLALRERGEWDAARPHGEWSTYCHRLPCHVFTHGEDGQQLVRFVVRLEDTSVLPSAAAGGEAAVELLPKTLMTALERMRAIGAEPPQTTGLMHACCGRAGRNARPLSQPWQAYYSEESARQVHEMFRRDFELFGYDATMPMVPDDTKHAATTSPASARAKESSPLLGDGRAVK